MRSVAGHDVDGFARETFCLLDVASSQPRAGQGGSPARLGVEVVSGGDRSGLAGKRFRLVEPVDACQHRRQHSRQRRQNAALSELVQQLVAAPQLGLGSNEVSGDLEREADVDREDPAREAEVVLLDQRLPAPRGVARARVVSQQR